MTSVNYKVSFITNHLHDNLYKISHWKQQCIVGKLQYLLWACIFLVINGDYTNTWQFQFKFTHHGTFVMTSLKQCCFFPVFVLQARLCAVLGSCVSMPALSAECKNKKTWKRHLLGAGEEKIQEMGGVSYITSFGAHSHG